MVDLNEWLGHEAEGAEEATQSPYAATARTTACTANSSRTRTAPLQQLTHEEDTRQAMKTTTRPDRGSTGCKAATTTPTALTQHQMDTADLTRTTRTAAERAKSSESEELHHTESGATCTADYETL